MPDGDIFYKSVPYHFRKASRIVFGVGDYDLGVEECTKALVQQLNDWSCIGFADAIRIIADAERFGGEVVGRRKALVELDLYRGRLPRVLLDAMRRVANRRLTEASVTGNPWAMADGVHLETQIAVEVLSAVALCSIAPARLLAEMAQDEKLDEVTFRDGRNEMAKRLPRAPMMLRLADQMMRDGGIKSRTISAPRTHRPPVKQVDLIHLPLD